MGLDSINTPNTPPPLQPYPSVDQGARATKMTLRLEEMPDARPLPPLNSVERSKSLDELSANLDALKASMDIEKMPTPMKMTMQAADMTLAKNSTARNILKIIIGVTLMGVS